MAKLNICYREGRILNRKSITGIMMSLLLASMFTFSSSPEVAQAYSETTIEVSPPSFPPIGGDVRGGGSSTHSSQMQTGQALRQP